jgi:ATP-dependent DNA helicase RecG
VGRYYAAKLNALGVETVGGLLAHYPRRYLDYGHPSTVLDAVPETELCLRVRLKSKALVRTRRGQKMVVTQWFDATGRISAVWFNQEYLISQLKVDDEYFLAGRLTLDKNGRKTLSAPTLEPVERGGMFTTGLVPVYPLTEGLSSRWLQTRIGGVLDQVKVKEILPETALQEIQLLDQAAAVEKIHRPKLEQDFVTARRRLAFNELLAIQLRSILGKRAWDMKLAPRLPANQEVQQRLLSALPFELTKDQQAAVKVISADLALAKPMNRLLQGDVGSGKTVVAALAMLQALRAGYQTILMAPTQVLAAQHTETLTGWLSPFGYTPELVISGRKSMTGSPLLVGTHALLHRPALFKGGKLGLVVIDEQHRFGVLQRSELVSGKKIPHLLTLTATPIPRTIAAAVYGHLDLSFLKEKPAGRREIKTWLVPEEKRTAGFTWVKKHLKETGSAAFIICPFVEQSEKETLKNVKAATAELDKLKIVFRGLKVGLLHGRMKAEEKNKILTRFADGKLDVLVATPVVEVGVDIRRASVMIIEDAWKFGLAALHQLRGRVGRNDQEAYCLLFAGTREANSSQRLKLLEKTNDGLELAEADLKLRGEGELFGTAQSGHLDTNFISVWDDTLRRQAKDLAGSLVKKPKQAAQILADLSPTLAQTAAVN